MPAVTTSVLVAGLATQAGVAAGLSLGASFYTVGLAAGAAGYYGVNKAIRGKDYLGDLIPGRNPLKPKMPEMPKMEFNFPEMPEMPTMADAPPQLSAGDEGTYDGSLARNNLKQKRSALLKTQGSRGTATLGGNKVTLA